MSGGEKKALAVLAAFEHPGALLAAANMMREAGYTKYDCHSPFPIHGMDEAMGLKRSPLGFIVGGAAIVALGLAVLMMWWMTTVDYPLVISGKPYFAYQAYTPIAFALTILCSAFAAFFGMFHLNRLPRPHHPLFYSEQFARVSNDGFMVSVECEDPKFDPERTRQFLESIGGTEVEVIYEP
ncbi:MAG: DUF3341 domain-containing protein [bacterium]